MNRDDATAERARIAREQARDLAVLRVFVEGCPWAIGLFTRYEDRLRLIACSQAWLDFHGHQELTPDTARGMSLWDMNPEVDGNDVFKAVHRRVSRLGTTEASDADALDAKSIQWKAWPCGGGTVAMAARFVNSAQVRAQTDAAPGMRRLYGSLMPTMEAVDKALSSGGNDDG